MPGIVSGGDWLKNRVAFLEDLIAKDPDRPERGAIDAELAELRDELRRHGHHWPRWLRLRSRHSDL